MYLKESIGKSLLPAIRAVAIGCGTWRAQPVFSSARCKRSPASFVKQMADEQMTRRIVGFPAGASLMIANATASVGIKLLRYLCSAIFIIAMAVSLLGCSNARLSPSLLLGNGSGTAIGSAAGAAEAPSFGGLPGNTPGYVVGIQIRD
jgi:hypothetical protein